MNHRPVRQSISRYSIAMRVIAGLYRGRQLTAPPGLSTRPILDRVKVAVFDWLGSLLDMPGSLPPITVLDIFCGGGSLGIEALSRGAAHCTFIELDRAAIACLRRNIETLRIPPTSVRVLSENAERFRAAPPPPATAYDLIFLDPPYHLSEGLSPESIMWRLLKRMGAGDSIAPHTLAIWRHDAKVTLPPMLPGGWQSSERRVWGSMAVTMLVRSSQVSSL